MLKAWKLTKFANLRKFSVASCHHGHLLYQMLIPSSGLATNIKSTDIII